MTTTPSFTPLRLALALLVAGSLQAAPAATPSDDLDRAVEGCARHLGTMPVALGQELSFPLNIVSWNIQKSGNPGWQDDLAAFATDSQLTFVQEAALFARLAEVRPDAPLYQSFAQGYTSGALNTGVMTLSTRAPTMQCNFTRLEPWLGTPKAAAVTEHALLGHSQRLLAINLHAVNFTLGTEDLRQQLRPLETLLSRHRGPVILAGDFNTWSAARQALVDAALARNGLQALSFEPDLRTTAFGKPLDHIFVRGLAALHTEVIPVRSSDHNMLRARLQLTM